MTLLIKKSTDLSHYRKLTLTEGAKIYAQLRKDVQSNGVLDRAYLYYFLLTILDVGFFTFFVFQFIIQQNIFILIMSVIGIAFFTVRIGGLIHDAGHRSIFKSAFMNDLFGYVCSFFIAFPYTVWRVKHNAHHAHTNEEGEDPDVEVPISFTENMFRRNTLAVRFMRKNQSWLYYVLGPLLSFTIRLKAFRYYIDNFHRKTALEVGLMLIGLTVWYVAPFFIFPFWKALLFFSLINIFSGFYMLNVFAPNHKGMPYLEKGVKFSFIEHQVMTARNLYGHWLTDYIFLGLNYQIEHHLFPATPRYKLKQITPFIKKICKKYKLTYTNVSVLDSNKIIYSELKKISQSTTLSS